MNAFELVRGKIYKVGNEFAEFAYLGGTGYAIFHPPGEPGMQSSFATLPKEVEREATLLEVVNLQAKHDDYDYELD